MSCLERIVSELEAEGVRLRIEAPDGETLRIGTGPPLADVRFATDAAWKALERADHLALAEAFAAGDLDVDGDLAEALRIAEVLDLEAGALARLGFALRFRFGDRRRFQRRSIAFHYDRPVDFFLPWFERWRSYSHGFYESPSDQPDTAQARKLQYAIDALELEPGMRVLDVGAGWGGFLEYAGRRGIEVHGITISEAQYQFLSELIRQNDLPCRAENVDLLDLESARPFDAAVFMGSFEHLPDYPRVVRRMAALLAPGARVYADFCAQRSSFQVGAFMARYVWPGTARYVDVARLLDAWLRADFAVETLSEDTASYALTVRDWARRLEACRDSLAPKFGEDSVRIFLVYLWAAHHFLRSGRTQAYHVVVRNERAAVAS